MTAAATFTDADFHALRSAFNELAGRYEADIAALQARITQLETGHQEHATELASLGVRLGELQLALDRLINKATKQGLTLDRQTKVMERVESLLETLVRQQTPSVVVAP